MQLVAVAKHAAAHKFYHARMCNNIAWWNHSCDFDLRHTQKLPRSV